uniref:Homeobox domain-containing protein n=1 Tax=Panagrolaimus sp. ES5 TaxID=591445 RepID=A0AC34FKN5_9BILA
MSTNQNQFNSMLMMAQMYAAMQMLQASNQQQMPIPMSMNPMFINSPMSMLPPPLMNYQQTPYSFGSDKKIVPRVNNQTSKVLLDWFNAHISKPYPEAEERQMLREQTGFNDTQIGDWFRNRRRNIKKANNGNVPWKEPPTGRKRRASSRLSNFGNDSNMSTDSISSTAAPSPAIIPIANPILSTLLSSISSTVAVNVNHENNSKALSSPSNDQNTSDASTDDSGFIDVITVDENQLNCSSNSSKLSNNYVTEDESSSPPEKRQKLWTINDIIE